MFLPAILLWMAFPPVGWWPLAWLAPIGWIRLATQPRWHTSRPYGYLYLAGLLHWLLMVQWIRLPHWSAYFGWLLLAVYLAAYVPLFVVITRCLSQQWKLQSWLAAPIAWTGLELAKGYLLTGFSMSLLGHSQVDWPLLLQISDLVGAYGVSFIVVLVAAGLEALWPAPSRSSRAAPRWLPIGISISVVLVCLSYGKFRMDALTPTMTSDRAEAALAATDVISSVTTLSDIGVAANAGEENRLLRVALIQGSLDTEFDADQQRGEQRVIDAFFDYVSLSRQAVQRPVDVLIWPESMFSANESMVTYEPPVTGLPGWEQSADALRSRLDQIREAVESRMAWTAQQVGVPLIVGLGWDHVVDGGLQRFNSAVLLSNKGRVKGRYDKMHPVMFGEYVPFGKWLPWLYRLTPMSDGLTVGQQPQVFTVRNVRLSTTICFENTVPQLMRRQLNQLIARGENPDVLVTITNDGWFWGSSLLDVHLACGVFRAIELRRPLLIAANTGFSASIAATGRITAQGPRRDRAVIHTQLTLPLTPPSSLYARWGDWFAGLCLATCLVTCAAALKVWRSNLLAR